MQVSGVVQHLNRLAILLTSSDQNWNDPGYKVEVYESITSALAYARSGHGLVHVTTGRTSDVATQLGTLAWVLDVERENDAAFEGYLLPAQRLAESSAPASADDRSTLESLGRKLRDAGWPLQQTQSAADVEAVHRALEQFLAQERQR